MLRWRKCPLPCGCQADWPCLWTLDCEHGLSALLGVAVAGGLSVGTGSAVHLTTGLLGEGSLLLSCLWPGRPATGPMRPCGWAATCDSEEPPEP